MSTKPQEIHLKDYKRPYYWIKHTELLFEIEQKTTVSAKLTIERNQEYSDIQPLVLNGIELELISVAIDGLVLGPDQYEVDDQTLTIHTSLENFVLETKVIIDPDNNLSCEGLYKSGAIYCTQNEAEGFRKITYFQDRPDIMSSFKTVIISDKKRFPYILSNGNLEQKLDLEDGKHKAIWSDPFPKPCYLFALVAGDLGKVEDSFKTMSGRNIKLEIFVDHGNEDKTLHAMESLKKSMQWDEEKFGLEYDLDLYMIVAVDSFNMGAMENKGLNIFNSAYVLAKQETATDQDFKNIEGVIGHEYFHNWTGNRVTCRDWFQLTLKEGLTVFRDQEFSSDMGSRAVKHIEDIQLLKLHQFSEDAGPLSHPIQPKSYIEINNFYTFTVYEKGAQVIRMVETLIGKENFRKGMDLYFERFDGKAVTTNDFVDAMADASDYDLEHFKTWYDQNGTPVLDIQTNFNPEKNEYHIRVEQKVKTNNSKDCLYMPFNLQLIDENGELFEIENEGKFVLNQKVTEFNLTSIASAPIPVWNVGFAAPVNINYDYNINDLFTIMTFATDSYGKFEAAQILYHKELDKLANAIQEGRNLDVEPRLLNGMRKIIEDDHLDNEFKSFLLTLPSEKSLLDRHDQYDFDRYREAHNFLVKTIGLELYEVLTNKLLQLDIRGEFAITHEAMGKRALKIKCMYYLAATSSPSAFDLIYNIYSNANNMTDEHGAFTCLVNFDNPYQEKAKQSFYDKWKHETLVIQKWIRTLATSKQTNVADLQTLEALEVYDKKVPNLVRSLYGAFMSGNLYALNVASGEGYQLMVDKLIEIDSYNPQLAARLTKSFDFYRKLDDIRRPLLKSQLERLRDHRGLSNDTFEIVSKNLEG